MEKREPFNAAGRNLNWCRHYGKQYKEKLKINLPYDPVTPLLDIDPKDLKEISALSGSLQHFSKQPR